MDNVNRVLAFHRWVEGVGRDVIVVASLNESTLGGYRIPIPGRRRVARSLQQRRLRQLGQSGVAGNGGRMSKHTGPA